MEHLYFFCLGPGLFGIQRQAKMQSVIIVKNEYVPNSFIPLVCG